MRRTLLRGEAAAFGRDVCDAIKVTATPSQSQGARPVKRSRVTPKVAHWEAVMQAGLEQHRIGTFDSGRGNPDRRGPRMIVELPPAGDVAAIQVYHNRLMMLCGIGYTTLCEAIEKRGQRHAAAPRVPAADAPRPPAGLEGVAASEGAPGVSAAEDVPRAAQAPRRQPSAFSPPAFARALNAAAGHLAQPPRGWRAPAASERAPSAAAAGEEATAAPAPLAACAAPTGATHAYERHPDSWEVRSHLLRRTVLSNSTWRLARTTQG